MKTKFFILISILCFNRSSYSQLFWDEVTTGVSVQLNSVSNVNEQTAWACGQNSTVIKTSNYGYNWTNVSGNGIPANTSLVNIWAIDGNTAIVSGYIGSNTFVYRTSNGGANWSQVFTQTNGFINAVCMTTATSGFMQGDPVGGRWSLWKTTNGGINWDSTGLYLPQASTETGWNNSLFMNSTRRWFGTGNTRIYYSTTGGTSWQVQSTSPEVNTYSIGFDTISTYTGFTGGSSLLKTTNAGVNWAQITAPGTGNINGIVTQTQFQNGTWYVRGSSIFYSGNSGINWFTQFTASSGTYTHLSRTRVTSFSGPGYMYATKTNGGITRGNLIVEGVKIISGEIPVSFRLYQNYPNPFNPVTKIIFSLAKLSSSNVYDTRGAFVSLKVYDVQGIETAILHDKIIQPGTYEAEWDASVKASGIYYYRLIVSDPKSNSLVFSEAKKMVLIK